MRAAVLESYGEPLRIESVPEPEPEPHGTVVEVEACGICHSDAFVKEGTFPGIEYPRVPGHEVAGVLDTVGSDVSQWSEGERVGVGWHGGHCFTCDACREGDFVNCENGLVTGIHYDGGYAEYATVPAEAVATIPDELDAVDAAPLLCAGVTTYNALRHTDARPGDLVAVQGIGGLGHLGVQYAHAAGFETVALSRSSDKESLALDLGADHFVDTTDQDPAERLQELGGATVVLATAPASAAISSVVGGLGTDGSVVVVEEDRPIGLITDRKVALALEETPDIAQRPADELLHGEVFTADPSMSVFDAIQVMSDEGIRRLPIVDDNGALRGIVTLDDALVLLGGVVSDISETVESQSPRL